MRNSTLYDSCLAPADTSDHNSIMFKLSFLLGEIACSALTFLLNFGIIWYENVVSENRRTLINKMISLTSLYTMMHVLTTGLVANAVFVFDYRTVWFCDIVNNVSMTLFLVLALGYNETMILRYVYACKLETVGVLNEAFFRHLLVVLNFVFAVITSIGVHISYASSRASSFCACMDIPIWDCCPSENSPKFWLLVVASLAFIHIVCPLAIHRHKSRLVGPAIPKEDVSFVNASTGSAGALSIALMAAPGLVVFAFPALTGTATVEDLGGWERVGLPLLSLGSNVGFGVVVPGIFYVRNAHLRATVWRCYADKFKRIVGNEATQIVSIDNN